MRGPLSPGGERARVAERVRAVLAQSLEDGSGHAPPDPPAPRGPLQWAPVDPAASPGGDVVPPAGRAGGGSRPGAQGRARRPRSSATAQRLRLDPGPRAVAAVAVAALLAAVVAGAWVVSARPSSVPVEGASALDATAAATVIPGGAAASGPAGSGGAVASRAATAGAGPSGAGPSGAGPPVVVDVAGKVRRPGVYALPAGARIIDAVHAAGGALPGVSLTSLNLAARVIDGQQVLVGHTGVPGPGALPGAAGPSGPSSGGGGTPPPSSVNLNTASLEQLEALPGVGPVLAQHILDWRTQHGSFATVDQLREVSGIGDVKFAALRPLVIV